MRVKLDGGAGQQRPCQKQDALLVGCALAWYSVIGSDYDLEVVNTGIQDVEFVLKRQRACETCQDSSAGMGPERGRRTGIPLLS